MFKLVLDPIDFQAEYEQIKHPENGCILFFLGVSRNSKEDKGVKALEYSAYEDMVYSKAQSLIERIQSMYPLNSIVIVHRLGVVPITEASLLVMISGSHRKLLFEALEVTVDLIKREIPIWKKAIYESGDKAWLENHF